MAPSKLIDQVIKMVPPAEFNRGGTRGHGGIDVEKTYLEREGASEGKGKL